MSINAIIILFSVFSIWFVGNASHHHDAAPAPAVDCSTLALDLVDCLSFVTSGSTVTKPEKNCCSGLKTVLKTDADCLCESFKNSAQLGISLNVTKAMTLPSVCHLSGPPVSNCGLNLVPGAAPATSPSGAVSPTAGAPVSIEGGNEFSPAPAPKSSGSTTVPATVGSLIVAVVAAASFSFV